MFRDFAAAQHAALVAQQFQQVELAGGELDGLAGAGHGFGSRVHR